MLAHKSTRSRDSSICLLFLHDATCADDLLHPPDTVAQRAEKRALKDIASVVNLNTAGAPETPETVNP
eukprot:950257-Amphidinium_carterae.1